MFYKIYNDESANLSLSWSLFLFSFLFLKDFIYLFLERGERREKERERNINVWLIHVQPPLGTWPAAQVCALTGNQTSDPLVCSLALNPLSHTSQGHFYFLYKNYIQTYKLKLNAVFIVWETNHLLLVKLKTLCNGTCRTTIQ